MEELIYPSEYDPPVSLSPSGGLVSPAAPRLLPIPMLGTAWDWKSLGQQIEVRASRIDSGWKIESLLAEVHLQGLDKIGKGNGMVEMPRFSVQALWSATVLSSGRPVLLGTMSPPREMQGGKEKRVWLVFVTAGEKK